MTERTDIVTRLRVLLSKCCIAPAMGVWSRDLRDAADEIERLREALRIEQEELAACFIDRKETQRERDDARREVCEWVSLATRPNEKTPQQVAESRGWYCFNTREVKND